MWTRRVMAALLTAPLVGLLLGAMPSAQAAPDPNLTVTDVTLSRTAVAVSGPLRWMFSTDLKRTAGTLNNGTWTGPLNVPSTGNGTFKVTGVMPRPFGVYFGDTTEPTPFAGPSVTVTGYHLPKITASVSPKVVPFGSPYSIRWAVTDAATGKPYGTRITVLLGVDNQCAEDAGGDVVRTDTNGVVAKSYAASDANWVNCLRLTGK